MSRYMTALQTTTKIKQDNIAELVTRIKAIASGYPSTYAWRDKVLQADSLTKIADIFEVELHYIKEDVIPLLHDTYKSQLFTDLLPHIAPLFENGIIAGVVDNEPFTITFDNGKAVYKEV